jgi:hypothetical protein
MSVTIIKEGNTLRLLESSEPIPDGTKLVLFTEEELRELEAERRAWLDLQMPSFIRGDEDEVAEDIFEIPGRDKTSESR